jgi:hypothetical protein
MQMLKLDLSIEMCQTGESIIFKSFETTQHETGHKKLIHYFGHCTCASRARPNKILISPLTNLLIHLRDRIVQQLYVNGRKRHE